MIAWIDLETTGLQPHSGSILEIAIVLTNDELEELAPPFERVVRPLHGRELRHADEPVRRMHLASGLAGDTHLFIDEKSAYLGELRTLLPRLGDVEREAVGYVMAHAHRLGVDLRKVPLGGNSVHFDRAWLQVHMDDLERLFSHRHVDVSTLTELARRWAPGVHAGRPGSAGRPAHRALADVRSSIETLRYYRAARLFGAAEAA